MTDIEKLTMDQRLLRYSLCVDVEIFLDEHEGATAEDFIRAFHSDEEWFDLYTSRLTKTKEDVDTVLRSEIFPRYNLS